MLFARHYSTGPFREVLFFGSEKSAFTDLTLGRLRTLVWGANFTLVTDLTRFKEATECWSAPRYDIGLIASHGSYIPRSLVTRCLNTPLLLNAHPSELPRYRGAAPIQRSLMNGDRRLALTVIDCDSKGFDTGNVWKRTVINVDEQEAWFDRVQQRMASLAADSFADIMAHFDMYAGGRKPQEGPATVASRITHDDARMCLDSASAAWNLYRSIGHQERLYFAINGYEMLVHEMHFLGHAYEVHASTTVDRVSVGVKGDGLVVRCPDGGCLKFSKLGIRGKSNVFSGGQVWRNVFKHNC